MAMPHIVCNYCEDVILDVHSCTIYKGTIYHWLCLVKMKEEREELPESIDGRDGTRGGDGRVWDGKPLGNEPSVYEVRKDSLGLELPRLRRFLKWLFRRKT